MVYADSLSHRSDVVVVARDAVIEAIDHGVIVLDDQARVLDMNPAAQEIAGQSPEDAVGQPVSELLADWPDLLSLFEESREGQAEISIDGEAGRRVFDVRLSVLADRGGQSLGRFVLMRDVTEHKQVERALREAKEAAEASDEAKSEFMSVASHEMRTPITSIKGYTDLLSKETVGPINTTQASFLDTIRSNADRISLLVSDLSDIARIESGRLRLDLATVDLADVVREAVESLQTQIADKKQRLSVDVPENLPPVRADRGRLVQVLSNLISNAHKFTPEGGQIVVLAAASGEEDGMLVAVHDDGIGIRTEEQDKVFEKFYRSDDRQASEMPGSGLGLSIAASLVELQGGQIWLDSAFREGTTVRFTVPIAPPS